MKTAQPLAEPQLGPTREAPSIWGNISDDWKKWWKGMKGQKSKEPKGEVVIDPKKVNIVRERVVKHPSRYRYDDLVKDVQTALVKHFKNPAIVGRKGPDGFWGPATSAAWNKWRAATGNDAVGVAKGRRGPGDKALYWMAYKWAPAAFAKAAPKPAAKPAPKPAAKPAPKPVKQRVDPEYPPPAGESERQKQLRRMLPPGDIDKPYGGA